jgi:7,8-dihydropterin-6-yl-methyl-4-(beta-D-ribofuranosyl)aminobenzene 5'-phosphate synthase
MITLRCLVDNNALHGSAFWGEHGVSFLIETPAGRVLFDLGKSGDVFAHNSDQMMIDLNRVDALVLSHAHNDHSGGLEKFFSLSSRKVPLYANPDLFRERYSIKEGQSRSIGLALSADQLARWVDLQLIAEPVQVIEGMWTTGEIHDRTEFQGSSPNLYIRDEGGGWSPDPYKDDLSLVLETGSGLVVVCGCCHAGLLNTLAHVRRFFSDQIMAIVGGTHLVSANQATLAHAVNVLGEYCGANIPLLYPNHCTGEQAFCALFQAFGEKVQPCPAGTILSFD